MRRVLLPALAAALALCACRDLTQQSPEQTTTAREAAGPRDAKAAAAGADSSSVCVAYRRQLAAANAALQRKPDDAQVQDNIATYQAIIADACN